MEQLNFYQVQVGGYSKRGNFIANNTFVCKSILKKQEVLNIYSKQYFGFSVLVSEISNIVDLESTQPDNAKNTENEQLKKEIAEIKKSILNRSFKSSIDRRNLPANLLELYSEMAAKYKEYNDSKSKIRKELLYYLAEKYKPFCNEIAIDKELSGDNYSCEYRVILAGELENLF